MSQTGTTMTPAEVKNLRTIKGQYVRIKWRDPNHDWPYYRLLAIDAKDCTIKVRGMDYPDGSAKHDGGEFHADWCDVVKIEPVMARI